MDMIFPMLGAARWVHFTSMFALFGGAFFWFYIGPKKRPEPTVDLAWTARWTLRLIAVAAPIAAVSGLAWLVATIANMTGELAGIADVDTLHAFFFETPFGPLAVARLVLLAAIVAVAIPRMKIRRRFAAIAAISALLLASQAWLGHAAEGGDTLYGASMIVAYVIHVLGGAAWIGGLPPLFLAIVERHRRGGLDERAATFEMLSRYSAMASVAVGLIVVSGVANTAFRIGTDVGALASTAYGDVLFAKLALVAIMLAFAGVNRLLLMPRLRSALVASANPPSMLETSVALEVVLGILVIGAAAILGITPPPH